MNLPRLHIGKAALISFALLVLWLAGVYLGSYFTVFFYCVFSIVCVSLFQSLVTLWSTRVYQSFSTDHPVKGESIRYSVTITNESFIPGARLKLYFRSVQPGVFLQEGGRELFLGSKKEYRSTLTVQCPFRGIYTIGLEFLEIRDCIGLLHIRRKVEYRTFYVLPRIIDINLPLYGMKSRYPASISSSGMETDFGLFEGYSPYREGESVRHMAWKKFVSNGQPLLKEYGKTSEPGISIYLDTRHTGDEGPGLLEMEDCSVEILVAFVKYCIDHEIPVSARAAGRKTFSFSCISGSDRHLFPRFHRMTTEIAFSGPVISPVELFFSDNSTGGDREGAVLFITHNSDPELLEFVGQYSRKNGMAACVVNRSGFSEEQKNRSRLYLAPMRERGVQLFFVDSADTIREDLMK